MIDIRYEVKHFSISSKFPPFGSSFMEDWMFLFFLIGIKKQQFTLETVSTVVSQRL